jgi:hypothetical protein
MFIITNGQLVVKQFNRVIQLQRLTDEERYRASLIFGVSDVIAQAQIKGLCYTKTKGI